MKDADTPTVAVCGKPVQAYRFPAEGPRLLLVHGWGGRTSSLSFVIHRLRRSGFDIVAFDAPGHGRSPGRQSNFYEFSEALLEVSRTYGPMAGVLAHSAGALCSLTSIANGLQTERIACINAVLSLQDLLFGHFAAQNDLTPSVAARVQRRIERRFGKTIWTDFSGPDHVARLELPALFFHDSDDPVTPIEAWLPHENHAANIRIEATHGLGHHGGLLDKDLVSKCVDFFGLVAAG